VLLRGLPSSDLLLTFSFDQLQHPEFLLRQIGERDREPYASRVENPEASPYQSAVRRVQPLFEPVLRAARPMANVDGLPIRAAGRAAIQLRLRRIAALPASEHAVGALFFRPAQGGPAQH